VIPRRDFITLLGGAAAWPLVARAQQPAMRVIGFVHGGSPEPATQLVAAFRLGLRELGFVDGQNVTIEYLWGQDNAARLSERVTDLVRRRVDVIATLGGTAPALAAKAATATIPIVFGMGGDPVQIGLIASLNRPGGNVTGVNFMSGELGGKRLTLLHELMPRAKHFSLLVNPDDAIVASEIADAQGAASASGLDIEVVAAASRQDIDAALMRLGRKRIDALLVSPSGLFMNRRVQIVTLSARHVLPTIFAFREYAEAGGLMSYGASLLEQSRQTGVYTGRVLKGERPADLPVLRATKFELVINLQTATILGLEVPPTLLARADEVIE
jgi:putative ABC transport system substrate-binding protein